MYEHNNFYITASEGISKCQNFVNNSDPAALSPLTLSGKILSCFMQSVVYVLQVLKAAARLQRLIMGSLCTGCVPACSVVGDDIRLLLLLTNLILWVFQQQSTSFFTIALRSLQSW